MAKDLGEPGGGATSRLGTAATMAKPRTTEGQLLIEILGFHNDYSEQSRGCEVIEILLEDLKLFLFMFVNIDHLVNAVLTTP